jgi:hypothetical protein
MHRSVALPGFGAPPTPLAHSMKPFALVCHGCGGSAFMGPCACEGATAVRHAPWSFDNASPVLAFVAMKSISPAIFFDEALRWCRHARLERSISPETSHCDSRSVRAHVAPNSKISYAQKFSSRFIDTQPGKLYQDTEGEPDKQLMLNQTTGNIKIRFKIP